MKGIIYIATNVFNGKSYVGQTRVALENRISQHFQSSKKSDSVNAFHHALLQYGKSGFEWRVLEEFEGTKEEVIHFLNVAEEYHILKLRTRICEGGYNATQGGYASDKFDGAVNRAYTSKAILQYDKNGNFVRGFESIADALRHYGVKHHTNFIGRGMWRGFQWRVKDEEDYPRKIDPYVRPRRSSAVIVYTSEGEFYKEYESINSCQNELGQKYSVRKFADVISIQEHTVGSLLVFRKRGDDYPKRILINVIRPKYKEKSERLRYDIPVLQYTRDGVFIREFSSKTEAVMETGVNHHSIDLWCKREPPLYVRDKRTEFLWQIKQGVPAPHIEVRGISVKQYEHKMEHRVIQYDRGGKFVRVWKNAYQASLASGDSSNLIKKQCEGVPTRKHPRFIWRYYSDNYPQEILIA